MTHYGDDVMMMMMMRRRRRSNPEGHDEAVDYLKNTIPTFIP